MARSNIPIIVGLCLSTIIVNVWISFDRPVQKNAAMETFEAIKRYRAAEETGIAQFRDGKFASSLATLSNAVHVARENSLLPFKSSPIPSMGEIYLLAAYRGTAVPSDAARHEYEDYISTYISTNYQSYDLSESDWLFNRVLSAPTKSHVPR
jgi:hypothetical protein